MNYKFEKIAGKELWQVRYKGEFICYMKKHENGLYTENSTDPRRDPYSVWSSDRNVYVDKMLLKLGYKNKNDFFDERMKYIFGTK